MGWVANETDGQYYEINNATEIPSGSKRNLVPIAWYAGYLFV